MSAASTLPAYVNRMQSDLGDGTAMELWSSLGISFWSGLDVVVPAYEKSFLAEAAAALETGDPIARATATLLRHLHDNETALGELNRRLDVVPSPLRALNIALHYLVVKETHRAAPKKLKLNAATAAAHVAEVWGIPAHRVEAHHTAHRSDAERHLDMLATHCREQRDMHERLVFLAAVDSDMASRARWMSKPA